MTQVRFCPNCGARIAIDRQQFCVGCGGALPGATQLGASSAEAQGQQAVGPTPVLHEANSEGARPPRGGVGWTELRLVVLAASAPFVVWLAFSLVAATLFADVFASSVSPFVASLPVVSTALGAIGIATYGLVSSLFAGLGYQLVAEVSGSALGASASGSTALDISAKAFGSLFLVGLATALAVRALIVRGEMPSLARLVAGTALVAAVGASAVFASAAMLGALLGGSFTGNPSVGFGPFSVGGIVDGSLRGGPTVDGLLPVTFVTIWLGALAGGLSAFGIHRLGGMSERSSHLAGTGSLLVAGVGGILAAAAVLSVPYLVAAVSWWLISRPADVGTGVRLIPALVAYLPNWIAEMAVLATGTSVTSTDTTVLGGPIAISIWTLPPWLIGLGFAALLLPGFLAGTILRGRARSAPPLRVALVTVPVVGCLLILGVLGLPAVSVSQEGISETLEQSLTLTFDPFQVIVVGGAATAAAAFAGFQAGGPVWRTLARFVPSIDPPGPPPVHFR